MSINDVLTPFTEYGGIDDAAAAVADPFSALVLRTMGKGSNRLLQRGHPMFNMVWAEYEPSELRPTLALGHPPPQWVPLIHPMRVYKKPGLTVGEITVRASVSTGGDAKLKIMSNATRESTVTDADNDNIITLTANGSLANTTLATIPLSPDPEDTIEIWMKGGYTSDQAMSTATYGGTINTGTLEILHTNQCYDAQGDWNVNSTTSTVMNGKVNIRFRDASGNAIYDDRMVYMVTNGYQGASVSGRSLWFDPQLDYRQVGYLNGIVTAGGGGGGSYALYEVPEVKITQIAMRTVDRVF